MGRHTQTQTRGPTEIRFLCEKNEHAKAWKKLEKQYDD